MSEQLPQNPEIKQDPVGKPLIAANLGGIGEQIKACFAPLGLQRETGMGSWKFSGKVNGRTVKITIATRSRSQYITGSIRYRKFVGLWMDISISTPVMSRLTVSQPPGWIRGFVRFLQRLQGSTPVTNLGEAYTPFAVYAYDHPWAAQFLGQTAVQQQLIALLQNPNLPHGSAISLSPGLWKWTTPAQPSSFTPEAAQSWLNQLAAIAALSEQTLPMTAVQPNWIERQNPTLVATIVALAFVFGIPLLLFTCCMLPALLLILLNTN